MKRTTPFVAISLAAASFAIAANAAEAGAPEVDPPRWSVPADTPAQKYAVAVKEAGAALEEARKECRAMHAAANERKACEADAREQWKREMSEARRHLAEDNVAYR